MSLDRFGWFVETRKGKCLSKEFDSYDLAVKEAKKIYKKGKHSFSFRSYFSNKKMVNKWDENKGVLFVSTGIESGGGFYTTRKYPVRNPFRKKKK